MDLRGHKKNSEYKKRKNCLTEARHCETKKFPQKIEDQKQKVSDLVYQYLSQVSNVHNRRKHRKNARNNFHRAHLRRQPGNIYPKRPKKKYSRPKSILDYNLTNNTLSYLPFNYYNQQEILNSQFYRPTILKNIVQDYAKAVSEGRNISRKYVCKALSFGVNSGFLVPTDDKGQMLRVSSNLCLFPGGGNIEKTKTEKNIKSKSTNNMKKIKTKRLLKSKNGKSLSKYVKGKSLQKTNKKKRKARNF